jgi:hypothetical protein
MSDAPTVTLTLSELPELRRKTEAVSQHLQQQLAAHLETLKPMFAPERVFGKYAGGKTEVHGTERSMTELQQKYKPLTNKPWDLPTELDAQWLTLVGSALELYPWEYVHQVQGKPITMSAPVRWVVNYRSNYTLANVRNVLSGKETVRQEYLRQFAVNALVLQVILARNPGVVQLFRDLRFDLKSESPPELKGLPIVTVTSVIASFRPADDLISAATAFSGVPAFIELLDLQALQTPKDILREKLEELTK